MKTLKRVIKSFFKILFFPLYLLVVGLIYLYKLCVSPIFPSVCIYSPSCSTYMLIAIKRFGLIKGMWLGLKRIMRCNPSRKGGLDRVPENIKGEFKWLI